MKITKIIEKFDNEQFKVGKLYCICIWVEAERYTGLFLCEQSLNNANAVKLRRIADLDGECPYKLRIDNENYMIIDKACEVDFKSEYDKAMNEWYIFASANLEE